MSFASGILSHISEGMVHSVYRKTINVQMGSSLVALQAAGSPLSPVSLITGLDVGEMSGLPVVPGDQVFVDRRRSSYSPNHPGSSSFDEAAIYDSLLRDYAVPFPSSYKRSLLQSSSGGLPSFSPKHCWKPFDFAKGYFWQSHKSGWKTQEKRYWTSAMTRPPLPLPEWRDLAWDLPRQETISSAEYWPDSCFRDNGITRLPRHFARQSHAALEIPTTSAGPFFPVRFPAISAAR